MKSLAKGLWIILALLLSVFLCYQGWVYSQIARLERKPPVDTALMRTHIAAMRAKGETTNIRYQWVPLIRVSPNLRRAVIVSEDATFYSHHGFDWGGIQKAMEKNLAQGDVVAGGSTITQQLAKNLFLSIRRTPWRKAEEAIITVMLEHRLSKRRILEIYLNVIEWGNGIFGAEAAARHYFAKPAAELTAREAAWLAAIVPKPRYFDRHRDDPRAQRKTQVIITRMGL